MSRKEFPGRKVDVIYYFQVMEETTESEVHCLCNHLTSFGGGFFVAPNPINFDTALQGFSNLSDNPTVFAFVMSLFGLYIFLVIWARRADLKDAAKVIIVFFPISKYFYLMNVYAMKSTHLVVHSLS